MANAHLDAAIAAPAGVDQLVIETANRSTPSAKRRQENRLRSRNAALPPPSPAVEIAAAPLQGQEPLREKRSVA